MELEGCIVIPGVEDLRTTTVERVIAPGLRDPIVEDIVVRRCLARGREAVRPCGRYGSASARFARAMKPCGLPCQVGQGTIGGTSGRPPNFEA